MIGFQEKEIEERDNKKEDRKIEKKPEPVSRESSKYLQTKICLLAAPDPIKQFKHAHVSTGCEIDRLLLETVANERILCVLIE